MNELTCIKARANSELPPRYYLGHFEALLSHVEAVYPELLSRSERQFIDTFRGLSESARCLYVRLINRRPDFFRIRRLNYPEIPGLTAVCGELERAGLLEPLGSRHVPELAAVLRLFTVAELRRLATAPRGCTTRQELIGQLTASHGGALIEQLSEPVVRRLGMEVVRVLKLLYFGTVHLDMDRFVIRDLGHVRFETVDPNRLTPYFRTRTQVEARLAIHEAQERFTEQLQTATVAWVSDAFRDWHAGFGPPDPLIAPSLDRLTLRIARHAERHGELERALALYCLTDRPPARERRARVLTTIGRIDEAQALCQRMSAEPIDATEAVFARDWLARRDGERRRAAIRLLARAEQRLLDERWRSCVEQGVLEDYRCQGWEGIFTENRLWRGLFGLLFWDQLFDPAAGAFHHPLQRAPSDLFRPEFYARRQGALAARLKLLDDYPTLLRRLRATAAAKWGISNPLVVWSESTLSSIEQGCRLLTPEQLRAVLLTMAGDPAANTSGFPDLLIWKDNEYAFVEVKSPTDQLSAQQLFWLERLQGLGVVARVLRVRWGATA